MIDIDFGEPSIKPTTKPTRGRLRSERVLVMKEVHALSGDSERGTRLDPSASYSGRRWSSNSAIDRSRLHPRTLPAIRGSAARPIRRRRPPYALALIFRSVGRGATASNARECPTTPYTSSPAPSPSRPDTSPRSSPASPASLPPDRSLIVRQHQNPSKASASSSANSSRFALRCSINSAPFFHCINSRSPPLPA